MSDLFDDGTSFLQTFIDDPREAPTNTSKPAILQLISDILNNPFVKLIMKINPIAWIIEAITEEIPGIQVPSLAPAFDAIKEELGDAASDQLEILDKAMTTFYTQLQYVLNDPSKFIDAMKKSLKTVFWTLFDSLRNFVESIYVIATAVIKAIGTVLDGVWKIPGVTDYWEDFTGQKFSILGFMTFGPAIFVNLVSIATTGKLPFDDNVELFDFSGIEIKPFYKSKKEEGDGAGLEAIDSVKLAGLSVDGMMGGVAQSVVHFDNIAPTESRHLERSRAYARLASHEKQAGMQIMQLSASAIHLPQISAPTMRRIKHIIQMFKYYGFAGDNIYSIIQTTQNVPERADNLDSWLSLLKLSGAFTSSLMLLTQSVIELTEKASGVHVAETLLGFCGVACTSFAMNMTRSRALDFGTRPDAHFLRDQQVERAKIAREMGRWLGWVGTTMHLVESEKFNEVLTYAHLASPCLSAGCWIARKANAQNAGPYVRAALYVALGTATANNTGLGCYHLVKAIQDE
jgi:hypothetical protein